jgi:hypothetical protein
MRSKAISTNAQLDFSMLRPKKPIKLRWRGVKNILSA